MMAVPRIGEPARAPVLLTCSLLLALLLPASLPLPLQDTESPTELDLMPTEPGTTSAPATSYETTTEAAYDSGAGSEVQTVTVAARAAAVEVVTTTDAPITTPSAEEPIRASDQDNVTSVTPVSLDSTVVLETTPAQPVEEFSTTLSKETTVYPSPPQPSISARPRARAFSSPGVTPAPSISGIDESLEVETTTEQEVEGTTMATEVTNASRSGTVTAAAPSTASHPRVEDCPGGDCTPPPSGPTEESACRDGRCTPEPPERNAVSQACGDSHCSNETHTSGCPSCSSLPPTEDTTVIVTPPMRSEGNVGCEGGLCPVGSSASPGPTATSPAEDSLHRCADGVCSDKTTQQPARIELCSSGDCSRPATPKPAEFSVNQPRDCVGSDCQSEPDSDPEAVASTSTGAAGSPTSDSTSGRKVDCPQEVMDADIRFIVILVLLSALSILGVSVIVLVMKFRVKPAARWSKGMTICSCFRRTRRAEITPPLTEIELRTKQAPARAPAPAQAPAPALAEGTHLASDDDCIADESSDCNWSAIANPEEEETQALNENSRM